MARYQVLLAYDGTEFQGFQRQGEARTVQGVVETALRVIGWQDRSILAAGRTDTGVHATGQVIAFDLDWHHSLESLLAALNANLPADVAAQSVQTAPPDFHPRFNAVARCYRYRIFHSPVRQPLRERYAWRIWPAIDVARLQQAACPLLGRHDFAALGTPPRPGGSTVRTVARAGWQADGDELLFEVEADAFLYRMVRRMVFLQMAIAQGRLAVEDLASALIDSRHPLPAGLAPPQGLTLVEVRLPS